VRQLVSFISQTVEKIVCLGHLSDPSGSQPSGLDTDMEVAQHFPVCRVHQGSILIHHVQLLDQWDIFFIWDVPIDNPETSYILCKANPISPTTVKNVHVSGLWRD